MSSLRLLFGTFIFLLSVSVFGQSFPVTAVVQSLPPFSNQISEWGDPLNSSLGVSLLLNDRNDGNYQVRLELTIEGNGVRLQTNNNWLPTPINLNYGQVVQLGGIELSEYLNLDHLSFTGYSRQAYVQNGGLPDGSYTICVRVFDYNRSQEEAASDRACTFVQASLLDPPVVLSPTGQQLPLNPQNLIIQWQARHTASFITDYRVEIYQVDPSANFTPEQIYSFQQPWVETQIDGLTTTVIDASFPQLETGYRYLLRVQARDPLGNNNFRNAGYSEPVFFDYGSDCPAPLNVSADVSNTEAARINWDYQEGIASSYVIRYRKKQDGANWYEEASIRNQVFLRELLEGTTYEVQVQSICSNVGGGLFGPLFEFTTPGIPVDDAVDCSAPIESLTLPTNKMLLQQDLTRGQEVTVGGFKMKIQSATKTQNGGWKGLGQVRVPWLFKTFNCRFHNLFINSDRVVFDGNVVAIDEGLSSLSGFMTVGEIFDAQDNSLRNFCGDTSPPRDTPSVVAYQSDDFYASGNPDYNNHYIPFDPTSTTGTGGVVVDDSQFYNEYNPNNSRARYTPSDYNNPNNPYTAEKPYDGSNIWNPWNAFNPYNYLDYDDPANPWSSNFIWTVDRMFDKQGGVPAAVDESLLSGGVSCPVKLGNSPNMLAIYGIKFTPTGAFLNAYFSATIPSVNQHTAFQAIGVGFGPSGLQGETKLKMLSDLSFSWNDKMKLTINGGNGTYVRFDCEGVNQVAINMKVEVCRNVAIPVDPYTYERDASGYVTGTFAAVADGWGEFAGDISITPFELDSLPGWAFSVQNAVFDFSTTSTPSSVQFPSGYVYDGVTDSPDPALRTGLQNPQWRGFYLGGARIRIPNNLTGKKENEPPVTIGAQHLIIDQTGFSGTVFGTNILSIDTGRLDSWAIGIDTVALGIQQNQFKKLAIAGELIVPAVDANLTYNCHIQPGSRYAFSLALRDSSLTMNAFVAEVRLDPNTKISLEYIAAKDTFAASAELHGKITFKPSLGGGNNDQGADTSAGSAGAGGAFGGASDASGADFNNVSEPQDTVNSLKVPYIAFQNFKLSSRAPYLENLGEWAIASNDNSQSKVAGFPLTLNQVGLFQNEAQNEVAFGIDLTLNLVKSDDQGFGANGRAFVICDVNVDPVTRKQEWKFKRVRLDKLSINYQGPGFAFAGYLRNYETHPVYGTGFQGGIQASFTPGIRVAVAAMFGTKKNPTKQENYRYFFADALLALDPGITLGTSGMALYGFGGGVSYHMKRQGFGDNGLPYSEAESIPADTPIANDTLAVVGGASDLANAFISGTDPSSSVPDFLELPTELGETLSGVSYVPDQSVGIGIKAMVAIGAVRREVFNGDITFEIIFNTNGSLNYIGLMGNANIMTPPRTPLNPIPKPAVAFFFDMGYDFMNNSFSAYLRLQVAAPPGIAYIRGAYPNNVAGEGNIYFSKDDWYFYLGRPNTPIKLSYDVSKLANLARADGNGDAELPPDNSTPLTAADTVRSKPLGSIDVIGLILTAYIEAGTILDPFPSPPQRVLDILGDDSFGNAARRDDPAFANAGGLLFGASLKLNMPKLNFLIFYAELYGGVGFDMMLKDYGLNARCANDLNNSDPIGFNGWYATGQLYGYLDGKVGIDIAIGALKLKVKILEVGAAALIQARLPNPMWAKGAVAGRFTVLNGLIKGNCKFDFEVGQECEVVPTGDQSIRLVQSITPNETAEESSVFARPQAIFNFEMNKGTVLLDETGQYMEFKPSLKSFRVTDSITGANIPGSLEWSEDKTIAAFIPSDILPPHRVYKVNIQSELYQRRSSGEPFRLIDEGGNIPPEQEDSAYFRTGTAPDHIPEENVAYAYPINLQANFLVEESDRGYVKLIQGQDYLFENIDPTEWNQQIRFQQDGAVVNAASYAYDALNNQLNFAIPANELARSVVSSFEIVDLPVGEDADLTSNVVAADAVLLSLDQGSLPDSADTEILLATQEANGALTSRKERIVYHLDFRTSHYDNFADKMAELKRDFIVMQDRALTDSIDANLDPIPYLKIKDFVEVLSGPEVFDRYELSGFQREGKDYAPLIRIRANPNVTANDWFNNRIRPNVYDNFPSPAGAPYNFNLSWRQEEPYGMPPVKAVFFRQNSLSPLPYLSNDNISSGAFTTRKRPVLYRYHLPYQIYRDYADYWNQAGNYIRTLNGTDPDPGLESFMEWDFIYPPDGDYEMIIEYVLPGQTSPSSTYQHLIPNEID
ncbi:fibronectin type III domain-containing protein [Neolewinella agarilytica]|uniref:Fibronectin type III domain-containing protein n=1 Tax=Neolewinella agarilytica TaxID=478744 RepID=A0A1H9FQ26_9BACT|nr:fibronectin type III domain-containing protein [Neolewinella agarilytica]SEQ39508.1 Fibronectin type III domain-containing protein [Neolewinella agarilytica]